MIILFKITSKGCSSCSKLSSHWHETKDKAESLGIKVVSVELAKVTDKLDSSKFPPCIIRGMKFFPTMIMMKDTTWRDCDNKWSNDNVLIFNGEIDDRGVIRTKSHGYTISTSKSVTSWIVNSNSILSGEEIKPEKKKKKPEKKGPVYYGVPYDPRSKGTGEYY